MKKHRSPLVLHRETVLCLQTLNRTGGAAINPIYPTNPLPETSPLCVSTCCGSCAACY